MGFARSLLPSWCALNLWTHWQRIGYVCPYCARTSACRENTPSSRLKRVCLKMARARTVRLQNRRPLRTRQTGVSCPCGGTVTRSTGGGMRSRLTLRRAGQSPIDSPASSNGERSGCHVLHCGSNIVLTPLPSFRLGKYPRAKRIKLCCSASVCVETQRQ
jgi:hypothetical protein